MLKAYKYRIYPNIQQKELIDRTFGICRLVYNLALETKIRAWQNAQINLSAYTLQRQLPELKNAYPWMKEVDSQAIIECIFNVENAFKTFFRGGGFPNFKKKNSRQSFQCSCNKREVDFKGNTISIPKIANIRAAISKKFTGKIKTISICRTATNKYFATILVECSEVVPSKQSIKIETSIGIDLGIKSFAVTSDGRTFEPNQYLKNSLKRLQCLQRRASRKKKGGNNRKKANKKVALCHEKITNQRKDYIHKLTSALVNDSQVDTYSIEDLNAAGMMKNRRLSKPIQDASFGEFRRQMQYKCDWYGKNLIIIGRFEPSSKTCSECGLVNNNLTLTDREWQCECGAIHDRDLNAATNILRIGLEKYTGVGSASEPVESRRLRRAKKQESNKMSKTI